MSILADFVELVVKGTRIWLSLPLTKTALHDFYVELVPEGLQSKTMEIASSTSDDEASPNSL